MTSTLRYRDVENWSRQVVAPPPPLIIRRSSTLPNQDSYEHPRRQSASSTGTYRGRPPTEQQPLQTSESFGPYIAKSMLPKAGSTSPLPSRRPSHDGYSFQQGLSQEDPYAPGSLAVAAAAITAIAASAAAAASLPDGSDIQVRRKQARSLPISRERSRETDTYAPLNPHDKSSRPHSSHDRHHHHHHHHHRHHHRHHQLHQGPDDTDTTLPSDRNEVEAADDDHITQDRDRHNYYPDGHRRRHNSHHIFSGANNPGDRDNSPTRVSDKTGDTLSTPASITTSPDSLALSATTSPDLAFTPVTKASSKLSDVDSGSWPTRQSARRQKSRSSNTTADSNTDRSLGRQESPMASANSAVSSRPVNEKPKSAKRKGTPHCCVIM
ncbi:hypothetical protein V1525DRAFT_377612 [Lipomyces kononenkoae]|uniref:Uncharacterized protein n=1 Tax=Lipomyces kononenkoae TaxID=34357 RepID=A0ACC3T0D4_LIPKO